MENQIFNNHIATTMDDEREIENEEEREIDEEAVLRGKSTLDDDLVEEEVEAEGEADPLIADPLIVPPVAEDEPESLDALIDEEDGEDEFEDHEVDEGLW